ncbi:S8 family serine peptidase [Bradyrhizobium sp. NBAIM03]|uniref:S8 family serine peptidase n=1 Tax=Bradyrhizobium sp. NBAIM03 TaxID=2793816 RepID=UPI001CD3CF1C|nr:S8 family serine peptidase [Bradyrhizobium sp. NBAIM03]MCA1536187.1 S8 family serine peptidase [Bradyrhizobium sp. NBAIM03]
MTIIDPHLQWMYDDTPAHERATTRVPVTFEWHGDLDELVALGMRLHATAGGIISAEMPLSSLPEVHRLGIEYIELARTLYSPFDVSRSDIKADVLQPVIGSEVGKGVIIGIVDTGIDYTHASFRKPDGKTRILSIWDQRLEPVPARPGRPPRFPSEGSPGNNVDGTARSGVEFTETAINDALRTGGRPLRTKDVPDDPHGSHVMGIAAGNGAVSPGSPAAAFVGMAPAADLIVVATKFNFALIRQGIEYIQERARARNCPSVINLSLGQPLGARDGRSLDERAIDAALGAEGRAIVISAGNDGNKNKHVRGRIARGATDRITFRIYDRQMAKELDIEIWYGLKSTAERFDVVLTDPSGVSMSLAAGGGSVRRTLGRSTVSLASAIAVPAHNKNRISIAIRRDGLRIAPGTWSITLSGVTVGTGADAGVYHGYLRAPKGRKGIPATAFTSSQTSAASTGTIPATALKAISVGAYVTRPSADLHKPAAFSSQGPTLDDRQFPTLCAPGQLIISAKAINAEPHPEFDVAGKPFTAKQGTSMAAPHVAGVVAAMLQVKPTLKQDQVAKLLGDHADAPPAPLPNIWGRGRVNALNSVTAAKAPVGS